MGSIISWVFVVIFFWIATIIFTIVLAVIKGYNGLLAFLLGLFIPLFGSLLVIALLPDKGEIYNTISRTQRIDSKVETTSENKAVWVCLKCGKANHNTALFCNSCGEKK